MITIKRSISFNVETKNKLETTDKKNKKPEGRVRCVIVWHGQRVRLSVAHSVNPDYWEKSLQRCRAKTIHGKNKTPASVINRDIDDFENLIDKIFQFFETKDCIPSKEQFINEYTRLTTSESETDTSIEPQKDISIFPIFDLYIRDNTDSGRWSESALKKNKTIRRHLYDTSPTLTFEELENDGMTLFIKHLSSIKDRDGHVGLKNDTIKKDISFVKAFVRWAQEKGFVDSSKFLCQKVRLKTVRKTVVFLDWDELMKIYSYDFGNLNYLSHARDVFCFCCFTSLRYSDVANLKRSNFKEDSFTFTTIKTSDTLTIQLNKYSKAILEKYANVKFPKDRVLPIISNQRLNEYIKIVGKLCGIDAPVSITFYKGNQRVEETHPKWEVLSFHAARRTFISNALALGIPPNIVMQWSGHSDYRAMKPYIGMIDKAAQYAMTAFDRKEGLGQNVGQKNDNE